MSDSEPPTKKSRAFTKKKVALVIGYVGSNYSGLQMNPGVETIEQFLEEGIYQAGGISDDNHKNLQHLKWARAARTDKKVHALGNVVSLKINPSVSIEEINAKLPGDISVFGIVKVTKSFNAKQMCSSREYCYVLPSYSLCTLEELENNSIEQLKAFRASQENIAQLNEILSKFVGTYNYHNFTIKKLASDKSAVRHIRSFAVKDVLVFQDCEFIRLAVHGDSFMIYQIRKMIGSLLAVIHKKLDVLKFSTEALFSQTKMAVPIAPGTGLYLEQCIFDTYNSKLDRLTREKCEGERGILNLNLFDDQRSAFFTSKIFPEICNRELADQEFKRWLIYLNKEWNQIVSNANEIIDSNELNSDDSSALE